METKINSLTDAVLAHFKKEMQETPQSPIFHGEGDVFTHTMMVCDSLKSLPEFKEFNETQQNILYLAALLHDIGKTKTTVYQSDDWHSPNHAPVGSRMAREFLFKDGGMSGSKDSMLFRETVCTLIRNHSFPPHAIKKDNTLRMHKLASNGILMPDFSIKMLCTLSKADMIGRKGKDIDKVLDDIELFAELAKEEGCYDKPYTFQSDHTRREFLLGKDVWKDANLYDNTWGEVFLMCGLPGSGKDYFIKNLTSDMPVISLDDIRKELKVSPTENQGKIANIAREKAKEHLRAHTPFIWNATNITQQMRESLVSLFESYKASVRIIYVEKDWDTTLNQNKQRNNVVPQPVIEGMLSKLTPPSIDEATFVNWFPGDLNEYDKTIKIK